MGLDWETHGVLDDFRHCQTTSKNTDLIFHCINGNVSAHQMIFAGMSRLFTNLMQRYLVGQELIPMDLNVSLPEIRKEHVEMVVELVYTGQVRITKRDYQPFREICQLLDVCVPIADYDKFFGNQCDDDEDDCDCSFDDVQYVEHSEIQLPEVSIPLQSYSSPRVFVCAKCDAVFPLKIDLERHKTSQHGQTESQDSDPRPRTSPISPEPSTDTQVNTQPRRLRSSNRGKNLVCPPNDKRRVECPDCQNLVTPEIVRTHLTLHLRDQLNERAKKCESGSGIFQCQVCWFEASSLKNIRLHLALAHDMITDFANEAQMKFLDDAKKLVAEARHPSSNHQLMPSNIRKINKSRTRKRILEEENISEIENSDAETVGENIPEDESQALNEPPDALGPPMLTRFNKRNTSSIKNSKEIPQVVKCPDCLKLICPKRVREHLVTHLQAHFNPLLTKSKSAPELLSCQFCSFETRYAGTMRNHLGAKHEIMLKYTNAAQKKFIADAQKLMSHKGRKALYLRTRVQILGEDEDEPVMEEKDAEIGINNDHENAIETDSRQNNEHTIECPDCLKNIRTARFPNHLATHLRKQLQKFVMKTETVPKGFKCKLCSYESFQCYRVIDHVGVTHEMIETFANEEQKMFLYGTQEIFPKHTYSEHLKLSTKNNKITTKKTNRNGEDECLPETQENNAEIEMDNVLESKTTETESLRSKRNAKTRGALNPSKLLKKVVRPWKIKRTGKHTIFAADGEPSVNCPDCLRNIKPFKARLHLSFHMRERLDEHMMASLTANGLRKCKMCPYESAFVNNVRHHLALSHNLVMKFANEAQTQFLYDAGTKSIASG